MDYILFNSDGSINKKNLTDFIQKGNDGVNSIFVAVDGIDDTNISDYDADAFFELPNTDIEIATTNQTQKDIGGVTFYGWEVPIDANVTVYEGKVKFSVAIYNTTTDPQTTLLTYNALLTINPSVTEPDEVNITYALYRQLLDLLGEKVAITSETKKVYATDEHGDQTLLNYGAVAVGGELVQRKSNGRIEVPITPLFDEDATSKYYVDGRTNLVVTVESSDVWSKVLTDDEYAIAQKPNAVLEVVTTNGTSQNDGTYIKALETDTDYIFVPANQQPTFVSQVGIKFQRKEIVLNKSTKQIDLNAPYETINYQYRHDVRFKDSDDNYYQLSIFNNTRDSINAKDKLATALRLNSDGNGGYRHQVIIGVQTFGVTNNYEFISFKNDESRLTYGTTLSNISDNQYTGTLSDWSDTVTQL